MMSRQKLHWEATGETAAEGLAGLLAQLLDLTSEGLLRPEFGRDIGKLLLAEIALMKRAPCARSGGDLAKLEETMARFDQVVLAPRSMLLLRVLTTVDESQCTPATYSVISPSSATGQESINLSNDIGPSGPLPYDLRQHV
nr:hypothetical protein [uncultured Cupriavidus sp.]